MDSLVTCPYNPAHSIQRKRLQTHLVKCRRNYPGELKVCVYNATHHVRDAEMKMHLELCEDRAHVESRNLEMIMQVKKGGCVALPRPSTPPQIENDEDWNLEADRLNLTSYNPAQAIQNRQVIRSIQNATPAQRKAFRAAEKERLEMLAEKEKEKKEKMKKPVIPGLLYKEDETGGEDSDDDVSVVSAAASHGVGGNKLFDYYRKIN